MFLVDREDMVLWSQGILMKRHYDNFRVVYTTECEEANRRLLNGEKIGLTTDGELISTMQLKEGCFKEEEL